MIYLAKVTDISDPAHPLVARPGESAVSCNKLKAYTAVVGHWVAVDINGGNWLILDEVDS